MSDQKMQPNKPPATPAPSPDAVPKAAGKVEPVLPPITPEVLKAWLEFNKEYSNSANGALGQPRWSGSPAPLPGVAPEPASKVESSLPPVTPEVLRSWMQFNEAYSQLRGLQLPPATPRK